MPFDKAEARLKTIKKLQAQLKEYETECYPRKEQKTYTIDAHSYDKAMKDLMRLSEENKKLKQKYELSLEQTDKLEEENKNLNKYLAETKIHLCFEEDMKKLKEERDLFEVEFHKTLEHQANDCESYEKENEKLKEENKKLKETLDEVRLEIMHHNGRNRERLRDLQPNWQSLAEVVDYIDEHQRINALWSKRYDSSSEEED